jgi:hypothetical protein
MASSPATEIYGERRDAFVAEMRVTWDELTQCEAELEQIQDVADRLLKGANATVVFLVDKSGQLIAKSGNADNLDTPTVASFRMERRNESHIQRVGGRVVLITIYPRETMQGNLNPYIIAMPPFDRKNGSFAEGAGVGEAWCAAAGR